jgi:hypothetical protein
MTLLKITHWPQQPILLTLSMMISIFPPILIEKYREAEVSRGSVQRSPEPEKQLSEFRMKQKLPLARKDSLIIKELENETLVYDLDTDKAHCLNHTAAWLWHNCNGKRTISELRQLLAKQAGSSIPEEVVWLGLDQLERFELLDDVPAKPFELSGMNRRELVRRIGIAALVFPVIVSITAPTAQAQASPGGLGACCGSPGDCTPPLTCKQGPCNGGPPPSPSTKACLP